MKPWRVRKLIFSSTTFLLDHFIEPGSCWEHGENKRSATNVLISLCCFPDAYFYIFELLLLCFEKVYNKILGFQTFAGLSRLFYSCNRKHTEAYSGSANKMFCTHEAFPGSFSVDFKIYFIPFYVVCERLNAIQSFNQERRPLYYRCMCILSSYSYLSYFSYSTCSYRTSLLSKNRTDSVPTVYILYYSDLKTLKPRESCKSGTRYTKFRKFQRRMQYFTPHKDSKMSSRTIFEKVLIVYSLRMWK